MFEYDGADFSGWQKQPDVRTVEDEIERAFSTLYQREIDIIGQGRTDAGVHARKQVAHADLPSIFTSNRLIHAMRGLLPKDVVLIDADKIHSDFHARFSATERGYSYIVTSRLSPLMRRRAWCCGYSLDTDVLHDLAGRVKQNSEFVNFCIPDPDQFLTTECKVTESIWETISDHYVYRITANRFLRHMVRRLVGSMVQVAAGKESPTSFYELLDGKEVIKKGHSAPPHGLYLESVAYEKH